MKAFSHQVIIIAPTGVTTQRDIDLPRNGELLYAAIGPRLTTTPSVYTQIALFPNGTRTGETTVARGWSRGRLSANSPRFIGIPLLEDPFVRASVINNTGATAEVAVHVSGEG